MKKLIKTFLSKFSNDSYFPDRKIPVSPPATPEIPVSSPALPPQPPYDPNPVVQICGECGLQVRRAMMYVCPLRGRCPVGLGGNGATL